MLLQKNNILWFGASLCVELKNIIRVISNNATNEKWTLLRAVFLKQGVSTHLCVAKKPNEFNLFVTSFVVG